MTTVDRIFELLDELGMEQKEFAALIGTTDKTVSTWRTGRTHSYRKYLVQISEILGTTVQWLTTGEGPKKRGARPAVSESDTITEEDIKAAFFNGADPTLTPEERDAMWEDAQEYFRFKIAQRRRKQRDGE